jgi:hypothetical protein
MAKYRKVSSLCPLTTPTQTLIEGQTRSDAYRVLTDGLHVVGADYDAFVSELQQTSRLADE